MGPPLFRQKGAVSCLSDWLEAALLEPVCCACGEEHEALDAAISCILQIRVLVTQSSVLVCLPKLRCLAWSGGSTWGTAVNVQLAQGAHSGEGMLNHKMMPQP